MAGLQFRFSELTREVKTLKAIGATFLDPATTWRLDEFETSLNGLWDAIGGTQRTLELQELRTKPSEGAYEPGDRNGRQPVVGRISCVWDVRPVGE